MNLNLTARNRQILETLAQGKSLMETSGLLGINYPAVCTTRGILKFQGLDTTTEAGREKCKQWLAENPPLKKEHSQITHSQIDIAKLYAHGEPMEEIAKVLGLKPHTVDLYHTRLTRNLAFPSGRDRRVLLQEWLVANGFYPAGHDFTSKAKTDPLDDPMFN
jgi:DNA-binding CsgD family transcriptional regulator